MTKIDPSLGIGFVCLSVCLPVCLFCLVLLGTIPELFFYGFCACPGQAAWRTLPLCRSVASLLIILFMWIYSLELEPPTSFRDGMGGRMRAARWGLRSILLIPRLDEDPVACRSERERGLITGSGGGEQEYPWFYPLAVCFSRLDFRGDP